MNQPQFNVSNINPVMMTEPGFKTQFQQQQRQFTPNSQFQNFTPFDQNQNFIKINDSEYIKVKLIGKGTFGEVYLMKLKGTEQYYALKIQSRIIPSELEILTILKQKKFQNVVNTIEVQRNPNGSDFYVLMEHCECSLQDEIDKKLIDSKESRYIIKQISNGIKELHSQKIIHRDLKPENILVFQVKDRFQRQKIYKICDFGLSSTKQISQTYKCGTAHYMAPEQIAKLNNDDIGYDQSVDIWALGTIIYEIFSGKVLFIDYSKEDIYKQILNIKQEELDLKIKNGLSHLESKHVDLVISMVQIDSKKRVKIEEVLQQLRAFKSGHETIKVSRSKTDGLFQINPQPNSHDQKPQLSPNAPTSRLTGENFKQQKFQEFQQNFQQQQQQQYQKMQQITTQKKTVQQI